MITPRTKNNIAKFVADYNKTVAEVYGQESKDNALAEDCTTYYTLDITILKTKIKVATTYTGYNETTFHDLNVDAEGIDIERQSEENALLDDVIHYILNPIFFGN